MPEFVKRDVARQADRIISLVLGLYFTTATVWLYGVWRNGESAAFFEWLWPWVFLGAGVSTLAYAMWPKSPRLSVMSGALMVGSVLSRAITLLLTAIEGELSWSRGLLGASTWGAFGYLIGTVWTTLMVRMTVERGR